MTQNIRTPEKTPDSPAAKHSDTAKKAANRVVEKASDATQEKKQGQAFTVTLGFSSLMTALTALVGCVVVAFMMGVIVGRDDVASRPTLAEIAEEREAAMQAAERAALAQEAERRAAVEQSAAEQAATEQAQKNTEANAKANAQAKVEAKAQAQPPASTASTKSTEAASADSKTNAASVVMSPEELKYATALKGQRGQTAAAQKASAKPKPSTTATAQKSEASDKTLYDYVYQVASLKSEEAVDTLRAKLEGEGLRTRMSKSGDYLKVLVLLRGTTEQAVALQERMVELKLGKPLQQQKKAVE